MCLAHYTLVAFLSYFSWSGVIPLHQGELYFKNKYSSIRTTDETGEAPPESSDIGFIKEDKLSPVMN